MALPPLEWHIHEMLYGYVPAVVAGFLLTAIPNWTGRLPVNGAPLAGLAVVWLAGRIAMLATAGIGLVAAAAIDLAFLALLLAVTLREIVAGKNWRNLRVLVIIGLLITGNAVFHVEIIRSGASNYGLRIGIAAVILLIGLVGGRVIPSFTRNWLVRENPGPLPATFGPLDMAAITGSVAAFAAWIAFPHHRATGVLLLIAGALHLVRLFRWAGYRTFSDRLVLVLHVAYAFVALGFLMTGFSIVWPDILPDSAGIHAWTAGAIGMMTMAVMTRASLGHTGQALAATPVTQAIYAMLFLAAVTRICAACTGDMTLMYASAVCWVLAFGGFAASYGPRLVSRRPGWMAS
jgi:uncharacterized protein involved in response to NO